MNTVHLCKRRGSHWWASHAPVRRVSRSSPDHAVARRSGCGAEAPQGGPAPSVAFLAMEHTCHWTGCKVAVPPHLWGCRPHWFALPKSLRDRIWATYVPGQEITKRPSRAYLDAARAVERWIAEHGSQAEADMPVQESLL